MEMESVVRSLENKAILVTGATGFLAKIFVEKILRIQPNVKKLYLLLRASDAKSATERLQNEVIGKDLFKVLREKLGETLDILVKEKVVPVAGDVSKTDLGINDSNLKDEMWKEIDLVLNFAATTNFDERFDVALGINTYGALNVLNFAKKCVNITMLVHVSTAYVCGEDSGLIVERPFDMGEAKNGNEKIDIDGEKKLAQQKLNELKSMDITEEEVTSAMKDYGIERARFYGWPNTYVFTKAMGEMLAFHLKDNVPLIIVRPTMISSTYKDPFPGWIEGLRTIDSLIAGFAKGRVTCFISNPQSTLDVIPADMVVNAIIVGMVAQTKKPDSEMIYHLGSSLRNPVKFSDLHDYSFRYFTKNPWVNKDGRVVKIYRGKILSTMTSFYIYMTIHFLLPLKALNVVNNLLFQKFNDVYSVLHRKINLVMRLVDLYKPYVLFEGIFDDTNTENLRKMAREKLEEEEGFRFDPKAIDWEDYMMNAHIPGLTKHVMRG